VSDAPAATFWQVARRPRMIVTLLLLIAAAAVCGRLGVWQLDRAQVHGAQAEARRLAQERAADPVPLGTLLAPQTSFTGGLIGRKVEVTGAYSTADQLLVSGRVHDGRTGLLVLTPLAVTVDGERAVLPVVRGWAGDAAAVPASPTGTVRVVGYLQAGESAGTAIVNGRTDAISPAQLVAAWGGPIWTGYLVLASSQPAQGDGLALLDVPTRQGTGLNLQNLAYAGQWWIFGGFALVLWWRAVRDESRSRTATPGPSGTTRNRLTGADADRPNGADQDRPTDVDRTGIDRD
jgi:cytochrome oxidase assembly protein ShyY1